MAEPLEFDISISHDKQRREKNHGRRSRTGAVETSSRTCDHPGCHDPGKYRAPKSPDQLEDFYWFCRKHVREYNRNWNFFETEPSDTQTAENRETAKVGSAAEQRRTYQRKAWQRHGINDPLEILGANGTRQRAARDVALFRLTADERRAVEILAVEPTWSKARIRQKYTGLVKIYHPDLNGGFREEEDQLRLVLWAWDQIKNSRNFPA